MPEVQRAAATSSSEQRARSRASERRSACRASASSAPAGWAITTSASCATCRAPTSPASTSSAPSARAQVAAELGVRALRRRSTRCSMPSDARDDRRADAGALRRRARRRSRAASTLLIEKPITATLDEADEMLAIARAHGRARADRARGALQPRGARGAAVRRRAAVHRERPARAVQSARLRRRGGARPDDPRHRPGAHAGRRHARRRRAARSACRCSRRSSTSPTRGSRSTSGAVANITASRVSRERHAQDPHLPAERLSLARPRRGHGRVLPRCAATWIVAALAQRRRCALEHVRRARAARGARGRAAAARVRELPRGRARRGAGRRDAARTGARRSAVALRIVGEIERTLPALARRRRADAPARARA